MNALKLKYELRNKLFGPPNDVISIDASRVSKRGTMFDDRSQTFSLKTAHAQRQAYTANNGTNVVNSARNHQTISFTLRNASSAKYLNFMRNLETEKNNCFNCGRARLEGMDNGKCVYCEFGTQNNFDNNGVRPYFSRKQYKKSMQHFNDNDVKPSRMSAYSTARSELISADVVDKAKHLNDKSENPFDTTMNKNHNTLAQNSFFNFNDSNEQQNDKNFTLWSI